jgi:hypothetical protein
LLICFKFISRHRGTIHFIMVRWLLRIFLIFWWFSNSCFFNEWFQSSRSFYIIWYWKLLKKIT